jgi:hypothetical protein
MMPFSVQIQAASCMSDRVIDNVRGSGNWAELADGIIVGRQRVDAVMLCDWCAVKVMQGEIILAPRRAASGT